MNSGFQVKFPPIQTQTIFDHSRWTKILFIFSVNTTSMLEKLIAAVSNVTQQPIPNIINQQVLNLSKPKQAAVEPVRTSSIRLEQV